MVTKAKVSAECPSCGEMVFFTKRPEIGEYVECKYCEEALEVIDLEPVLLDFPLEEDGYDDDYDYDDDDVDDNEW